MSAGEDVCGSGDRFREVVEAKIAAEEGVFEYPHPFLLTACRGLANRIQGDVIPRGFLLVTELYMYDIETGIDSSTGEAMPRDVTDMPPAMTGILSITATVLAREAFGDDFADTIEGYYKELRAQ